MKVEVTSGGAMDTVKWGIAILFLAAIITGNTMYGELSVLYRALAAVAGVVIAWFYCRVTTEKGSDLLKLCERISY